MPAVISEFQLAKVKCAACVSKINKRLNSIQGISSAQVNLLEKTLRVEYQQQNLDQQVISAIDELGFSASKLASEIQANNLCLDCALPLAGGVIFMSIAMLLHGSLTSGVGQCLLTLTILSLSARQIFSSGWRGIVRRNYNMHSLIVLSVGSAWLYSSAMLIREYLGATPAPLYFESALIIVGLINLGSYWEERAKASTMQAIQALIRLQPSKTSVIRDGQEQTIASGSLREGDCVKIRPGEQIPADGLVTSGESYVDESMLSGEPLAVHKTNGCKLIAGSLNGSGSLLFRVTAVGDKTLLAEIIKLVRAAQLAKPALAKLADQIARVFVPTIFGVAVCAALSWTLLGFTLANSLAIFMSVLIIACPCSVGLAVPVALMVGIGRCATKGILIRNPACLGKLAHLDYILLDKTGTITKGKPEVVAFSSQGRHSQAECLAILKTLESASEHPLAQAILDYRPDFWSGISPAILAMTDFIAISGCGLSASINTRKYFAGSSSWVTSHYPNHDNQLAAANNCTQVFLGDEDGILARIDLSDSLKSDSSAVIAQLQAQGLKVAILSGDNQANVEYVAQQVGISEVYAACLPGDKLKIVAKLQQQGQRVAFVGDGINDAPSLTLADVGIAIGGGSDIAMHSADITLIGRSLGGIGTTIKLGSALERNMRQNLFGSFLYNCIAVLIAAGVLYPSWHILLNPMLASLAMSLSSLSVIFNALRLRKL